MRLERRRGKTVIVIDCRPSKAIRRSRRRIEKRLREIYKHFGKGRQQV